MRCYRLYYYANQPSYAILQNLISQHSLMIAPIAIYLPQFHPIPENDAWWGKGFTEWTNVTKARPRFKGHYQPHLPTDLGFYDLRLNEIMVEQARMAKEAGIYGFCFYHYWFNGKRLLNLPLDKMIESKTPDFPFMICWANENWSRRWDGSENDILMQQTYSHEDDMEHIRFLIDKFFKDERYIKVDGKPFFAVYRPALFPDMNKTIEIWNTEVKKHGFPGIYIGYMQSFNMKKDPEEMGFDAAIEFQPDFSQVHAMTKPSKFQRLLKKMAIKENNGNTNTIVNYGRFVNEVIKQSPPSYKRFPCVMPGWDNSARKKTAMIMHESTPEMYEKWLSETIDKFKPYSPQENFVFINAWNEWAEGNHLEPDMKWGNAYLEATKRAITNADTIQ